MTNTVHVFSVAQFLTYVNESFRAIWDTNQTAVEGEVSSFRLSQGQWINFDLKDQDALVSVFMVAQKLTTPIADGMRVRLFGCPRVYPKYGKFSFHADRIELVGEGALRKAFALLRQRLVTEGLFDLSRKRSLTRFPKRIALVCSRESAAYGDFIRILHQRWGGLEIDLYPVLVQGERAAAQMISAIEQAQHAPHPYSALVLTRGGGSFEELMAFNDERLVRALFACPIPTLVGIGHERDVTLAEEVADVRASTPTDCARLLVPDRRDVLFEIATRQETIHHTLMTWIESWQERLTDARKMQDRWLASVRGSVDLLASTMASRVDRWLDDLGTKTASLARLTTSFDPRAVIRRGYAIVRDQNGHAAVSVRTFMPHDVAQVELQDGYLETVITSSKDQSSQR